MTPTQRLFKRLGEECQFEIPEGATLHRTYAGRLQRQTGAWSWFILSAEGRELCGSCCSVTQLVRAPHLVIDRHSLKGVPPTIEIAETIQ
jgi:hypothetical protein